MASNQTQVLTNTEWTLLGPWVLPGLWASLRQKMSMGNCSVPIYAQPNSAGGWKPVDRFTLSFSRQQAVWDTFHKVLQMVSWNQSSVANVNSVIHACICFSSFPVSFIHFSLLASRITFQISGIVHILHWRILSWLINQVIQKTASFECGHRARMGSVSELGGSASFFAIQAI